MGTVTVSYPDDYDIEVQMPPVPRVFWANDYGPKGDQGPTGPRGPAGPGPAVIADTPGSVGRWTQRLINTLGSDDDYTASVDGNGALTISSPEGNTGGNNRLAMCLPESHTDVEMHALIQPPPAQTIAAKIPQVGLVLRMQDHDDGTTSAFVVDTNVASGIYVKVWVALWQWPTAVDATLSIDPASTAMDMTERSAAIRSAQRIAGGTDVYQIDDVPPDWADADAYDIACSTDADYNRSGVTSVKFARGAVIPLLGGPGPAAVATGAPAEAKVWAPVAGVIRQAVPSGAAIAPKAWYPLHVVARSFGTTLAVRTWPLGSVDPGFGNHGQCRIVDFSASELNVPTAGQVGLLANHVQGGKSVSYSDIIVTQLS